MGNVNIFFSWLGKIVAGLFIAVAALFVAKIPSVSESPSILEPRVIEQAATSSITDSTVAATTSPALPAQKKSAAAKPAPVPVPQPQAVVVPQQPAISPEALNAEARAAVVNILCTTKYGGSFEPISGSGVIIDSRGVILTNAHVAQFFLLHDYPTPDNINCVIRTGSPAQAQYTATLLYISPLWILNNAKEIITPEPMGTGENDYAFLLITGRTDPLAALPSSFPYIPISNADQKIGDQILLASYPAGLLGGIDIQTSLYLTSAYAQVQELFVFDFSDQWIDLFSVPGTVVSQGGSSGGAALRAMDGTLAGIIVTSTAATTTAGRDLRAISIAHIEHSLMAQNIAGFPAILTQNLTTEATDFNTKTAPLLRQKLIQEIH